jgi:molecular chaperone DnaK
VESRNKADALAHSVEKQLKDLGEKVPANDRASIESALADLKRVQGGDDKDVIETKANALAQAAASLQQAAASAQSGPDAGGGAQANAKSANQDDVVDAEFEEVNDKKKGA